MNHHSVLLESTRKHWEMRDLWALDTNQDLYQDWDKAKLKVLIVILSSYEVKAISSTYTCISTLMKEGRENWTDIFIDASFYPSQEMLNVMTSLNIPVMTGIASHRDWRDYDIIAVSHSIDLEALNLPHIYSHSHFPFSHEERMSDPNCPLVIYGGAASPTMFPALGGPIEGHGHSLYDIGSLGMGEPILTPLFSFLYQFNLEQSIKQNKVKLIDQLLDQEIFRTRLFYPFLYDIKHSNGKITSITRLDDRIPEKAKLNRIHTPTFKGFYRKYFAPNGVASERHDVQIASGCSSHCCSFCSEGSENGHYTEKPLAEIEQDILKSKCYSAANNYNAFSFNCNYYSQYFDMLKLFITHSSSTSIFNQRADVLGNSPDYVAAARKMGVMKISTACEGISERIRQNVLNKNLPRKTLVQACRNVFAQKMLGLKFTMILTGLENEEDIKDFYSTIDEILQVRAECRSNTKLSLTFTPLLYYIQTPFRWEKRITAKASWEHSKLLSPMIPFLMERGIKIKFYGSGITTYFEQLLIDAGWQATNIIMDMALIHGLDYTRGVTDAVKPQVEQVLEKYGLTPDFFFNGYDPDKDILPNDMIEFTTPQKLSLWREMYDKRDFYHPICLRTAANLNPKCYNCGACTTVEEKRSQFARSLNDNADLNSVLAAMTKAKPKSVIRFVVKQFPLYAFYSKEMLSHYITSQFIRRDEALAKAFYRIGFNSTTWVSDNFQLPMYSGNFTYDVEFKSTVTAKYLSKFQEEVNSVLETCKIVKIIDGDVQSEVTRDRMNLYLCNIPFFTPEELRNRLLTFDWYVKSPIKAFPTVKFVVEDFSSYKNQILFKSKGLSSICALALPIDKSPFSVIQAITKKPLPYCLMNADMQILETITEIDAHCHCGGKLFYSLSQDRIIKECPSCHLKRILASI